MTTSSLHRQFKAASLFFIFSLALISIHAKQSIAESTPNARPNVLLIITDDQGYGDVGFHGNEMIKTPTLDAFAKQSLRLTNFHDAFI